MESIKFNQAMTTLDEVETFDRFFVVCHEFNKPVNKTLNTYVI